MKKKTTRKRITSKLAGFTRKGKSYALVFKRRNKLVVGTGRYKSKATLNKAAAKYLK